MAAEPFDDRIAGFNLLRRFSILSFLCIAIFCGLSSELLTVFLREHMLKRYAGAVQDFVQSVADVEIADARASGRADAIADQTMQALHRHISALPETLRTNIYDTQRRLVWTSDGALKGQNLGENHELDKAILGEVEIETGVTGREEHPKLEHMFLSDKPVRFVEIYLPIRDRRDGKVFGVVEIYRIPRMLFESINQGIRWIWTVGLFGGLFLFLTLQWLVRRAQNTIRAQQERLLESETLATVGEMGTAVAHGIRNPLASIRSSAELLLEDLQGAARESASDIVNEVDKLEKWVRDLLTYSQPAHVSADRVRVGPVVERVLARHEREFSRRSIRHRSDLSDGLPLVVGDDAMLEQCLTNLVSNSIEAMPKGGELVIAASLEPAGKRVCVTVRDSGIGIDPKLRPNLFSPFRSTKPKGLGLGLSLVRRMVRRFGGDVTVESALGRGTAITLRLRPVSP